MASAKSLLGSLLRVLNKRQASPEDADKARRVEQARREYEQRLHDDERELDWRRREDERELVEGLRQTEIPEQTDPALRWAESGEWYSGFSSSNVRSIRYDKDAEVLEVEYGKPGEATSIYGYRPVPMPTAVSIYEAASKGTEIWDRIRIRGRGNKYNHQFEYYLISGPSRKQPQWMASEESRRRHGGVGKIKPNLRVTKGRGGTRQV